MASYHCSMKSISRKVGRSATASAAYRAGVEILDERTGMNHDYSRKAGVVHAEMLLPDGETADRAALWNAVEAKHKRGDAVVAREIEVALPAELTDAQRQELAVSYGRELANRYGVAVDVAIHRPSREGDGRNHHAHVLMSACHVDPDMKMGAKAVELDPIHCQRNGLENAADHERERWAALCNDALERSGLDVRVDHRSLEAQRAEAVEITQDPARPPEVRQQAEIKADELNREPQVKLGPAASAMERKGIQTDRGDVVRAVQARNAARKALLDQVRAVSAEIVRIGKEIAEMVAAKTRSAVRAVSGHQSPAQTSETDQQRYARMSVAELRAEITRSTPPPVHELVKASSEMKAIYKDRQNFEKARATARANADIARQEIAQWRKEHPIRAKSHDHKFTTETVIEDREKIIEDCRRMEQIADLRLKRLYDQEASTEELVRRRIEQAQAPVRKIIAEMEMALRPKLAEEQVVNNARRDFERLASRVAAKSRDWEKHYAAASKGLRDILDAYNRIPNVDPYNPQSERKRYVARINAPSLIKAMSKYQDNAKDMGLGIGRGPER